MLDSARFGLPVGLESVMSQRQQSLNSWLRSTGRGVVVGTVNGLKVVYSTESSLGELVDYEIVGRGVATYLKPRADYHESFLSKIGALLASCRFVT